jgi:hypothetical protein
MINRFVSGANYVQFGTPPLRGDAGSLEKCQTRGFDSSGDVYVYGKKTSRAKVPLIFPRATSAVMAATEAFYLVANGDKLPFTWYDHLGTARACRFTGPIKTREVGPGQYRIEIDLEEDS